MRLPLQFAGTTATKLMPRKKQEAEDRTLNARDKLLRDTFTPAELLLSITLLLCSAVAFWFAQPRSFWVLGFFLIAGIFTPVMLKTHERTHPFFVDLLWRRFWWLTIPIWWILLQSLVGIRQNPLTPIEINDAEFFRLDPVSIWYPSLIDFADVWLPLLGFCSIYIVSINLFIIPKSRAFFERVLPWLCTSAVLVGVYGLLQKAMRAGAPFFARDHTANGYFAFFAYDGHWAAFAILWTVACIAFGLLQMRYEDGPDFLESTTPWYFTGATLLGFSGFFLEARLPAAALLLSFAVMAVLSIVNLLSSGKEPKRRIISFAAGVLALVATYGGVTRLTAASSIDPTAEALRTSAREMFIDNPVFGWGIDSFSKLLPFYQPDWMLGSAHDRAFSDLYQHLAEFGLIGTLLLAVVYLGLVIRYFIGKHDIRLTNHLLIGCLIVLLLACVDSPFMSPAVTLSFLVLFFSAIRWRDLSRLKVDEVDAKVVVVTHEKQRKVPVFRGEQKEVFK